MKLIYLYVKTHNTTGLKYFGKTVSKDPHKYKGSGKRWTNHIKVHGYDVTTEIVGQFYDEGLAKEFALQYSIDNNIVESDLWANLKLESLDGGFDHINGTKEENAARTKAIWDNMGKERAAKIKADAGKKRIGQKRTAETCKKISEALTGRERTAEHAAKISAKAMGKVIVKDAVTGETIGKVPVDHAKIISGEWVAQSKGRKNGACSDERKRAISEANKGRVREKFKCEHCGMEVSKTNLLRWHGNNCKAA